MNKTSSSSSRIEWIDLAKGFCIILVVLYHVCSLLDMTYPLWVQTLSFRMPLYFILSGLFFKQYEGFMGFLKRKVNKLLIPFLFFMVFTSLIPYVIKAHQLPWYLYLKCEIVFNMPIWFLLCLFEVNIIFYIVQSLSSMISARYKTALVLTIMLALGILGFGLCYYKIKVPFFLDSSLSASPLFAFGWWLNRKTSFLRSPSNLRLDIPLIIVCALIVLFFARPMQWMYNTFTIRGLQYVYLCGVSGTIMVLLIAKNFRHLPVISVWGRYSIMILCTHYPIAMAVSTFFSRYLSGTSLLLLTLVLTMTACHFLIPFMKKYMPHVTAQKDVIPINTK